MTNEARQLLHVLTGWRTKLQDTAGEEINVPTILNAFSTNKLFSNVQVHPTNPDVMGLREATKDCWMQLSKHLSKEIARLYYVAATTHPGGSDSYSPTLSSNSGSTEYSNKKEGEEKKLDFYDQWDEFHGQVYQITWDMWDTMPHCKDEKDDPKEFFEYKRRFMIAVLGNMRKQMIKCYETPHAIIVDHTKLAKIQRIFEKYFVKMWDVYWEDTYFFCRGLRFGIYSEHGKNVEWVGPGHEVYDHCWKILEIYQLSALHYNLVNHFDINKLPLENKWSLLHTWRDSLFKELTPFLINAHGRNWARFPYQLYNHCTQMTANAAMQNLDIATRDLGMDAFKHGWINLFYHTMEDVWDDWKARLEAERIAAEKEAEQELTSKQKKNRLKSQRDKAKAKAKKSSLRGAGQNTSQEDEEEGKEDENSGGEQKLEKKNDTHGSENDRSFLKDDTNKTADDDENSRGGQKVDKKKKKKKKSSKKENKRDEGNQLAMDNNDEGSGSNDINLDNNSKEFDTTSPESRKKTTQYLGFMTENGVKGLGIKNLS